MPAQPKVLNAHGLRYTLIDRKDPDYAKGYRYRVAEDYRVRVRIFPPTSFRHAYVELTTDGWLTLKAGYASNGASWCPDTESNIRAFFIHDGLCQCVQLGWLPPTLRPAIDLEYRDVCIEDGMWRWVAYSQWLALREFGWVYRAYLYVRPIPDQGGEGQ